MNNNDFPLVYCNGDSYSDQGHLPILLNKTYANAVASACNGFVINKAISGSCNRRIIRTTLHDMILQRKLNPSQKIIALVGLSFELRSELWVNDLLPSAPEESNFVTHHFSRDADWRKKLLQDKDIGSSVNVRRVPTIETQYLKEYGRGRAYFFSPYSERINLLADLIMLTSVLDSLNIDFLIFQSPKAELLESDYLLDFFKDQISTDPRIFNLENFGFVNWCHENRFIPMDYLDRPEIGHYGPDAHRAFAEQILIPKLKELSIL
jgi:hypothetical protein